MIKVCERSVTVVAVDEQVNHTIEGDVVVAAGGFLELDGVITGDLVVDGGAYAIVRGTVAGVVRNGGGHLHLLGSASEVIDTAPRAVTVVEPGAVIGR